MMPILQIIKVGILLLLLQIGNAQKCPCGKSDDNPWYAKLYCLSADSGTRISICNSVLVSPWHFITTKSCAIDVGKKRSDFPNKLNCKCIFSQGMVPKRTKFSSRSWQWIIRFLRHFKYGSTARWRPCFACHQKDCESWTYMYFTKC